MDHCCSPDMTGGIGMDNMTIMIIAILNGRTIDQWYEWVAERVEKGEGYDTPDELPQVYSSTRLLMASQKREKAKGNMRNFDDDDDLDEDDDEPFGGRFGALSALKNGNLTRILVGGGADIQLIPAHGGAGGGGNMSEGLLSSIILIPE
jgi:protein phosphatase PTC2/3